MVYVYMRVCGNGLFRPQAPLIRPGFRQMFWPSLGNLCQMSFALISASVFIPFRLAGESLLAFMDKLVGNTHTQTHTHTHECVLHVPHIRVCVGSYLPWQIKLDLFNYLD